MTTTDWLCLAHGEDRYVFVYDAGDKGQVSELLRTLGRFASDSRLNFTWYDAARLSQKIRLNKIKDVA